MRYGYVEETLTIAHCFFCGKSRDQVTWLTPGPGHLFICNGCVDFCRDMVEQGQPLSQWRAWQSERAEPAASTGPIDTAYGAIRRVVLDYAKGHYHLRSGGPDSNDEAIDVVGNRLPARRERSGSMDDREHPAIYVRTGP